MMSDGIREGLVGEHIMSLYSDIFLPLFANTLLEQALSGIIGCVLAYKITGIGYMLGLLHGRSEGRGLHWKIRTPLVLGLSLLFGWVLNVLSPSWQVALAVTLLSLFASGATKHLQKCLDI